VRRYCTYFDANYLARGLALAASLRRHAGGFELTVLCMDDETRAVLGSLALPGVRLEPVRDLEQADPELAAARRGRPRIESYFTCTPPLILHCLDRAAPGEVVTYLDADLWFLASPAPLEAVLAGGSVLIIPHGFPPALKALEKYGVYNVGYVSFRNDDKARRCAQWWRRRCIESCGEAADQGVFGDQKYLDDWPERFKGVKVANAPGAGLAPWNVAARRLSTSGGRLLAQGDPVVFYHFHGLELLRPWLAAPRLKRYGAGRCAILRRELYAPYLRELAAQERLAQAAGLRRAERSSWGDIIHAVIEETLYAAPDAFSAELDLEALCAPLANWARRLLPSPKG